MEMRRRWEMVQSVGGYDVELIDSIEVTGCSLQTSWVPKVGAIVKWDMITFDNPELSGTIESKNTNYFKTTPKEDNNRSCFSSNSGSSYVSQRQDVYVYLNKPYGVEGFSPYNGTKMPKNTRITYIWDSLNGTAGYGTKLESVARKTDTSNYPLELFCSRNQTRVIIYKIELINQDGDNMTLLSAKKDGVVGFYIEETGDFMESDNDVPFKEYVE